MKVESSLKQRLVQAQDLAADLGRIHEAFAEVFKSTAHALETVEFFLDSGWCRGYPPAEARIEGLVEAAFAHLGEIWPTPEVKEEDTFDGEELVGELPPTIIA